MRKSVSKILTGVAAGLFVLGIAGTASAGEIPRSMDVSPAEVTSGGKLTVSGTGCLSGTVHLSIGDRDMGTTSTGMTGAWSAEVTIDADIPLGENTMNARCVTDAGGEEDAYIYSGVSFMVLAASETTTTTTTTTVAPTTAAPSTTATPPTSAPGETKAAEDRKLAFTGSNAAPLAAIGATAVIAGVGLLLLRRRTAA